MKIGPSINKRSNFLSSWNDVSMEDLPPTWESFKTVVTTVIPDDLLDVLYSIFCEHYYDYIEDLDYIYGENSTNYIVENKAILRNLIVVEKIFHGSERQQSLSANCNKQRNDRSNIFLTVGPLRSLQPVGRGHHEHRISLSNRETQPLTGDQQ